MSISPNFIFFARYIALSAVVVAILFSSAPAWSKTRSIEVNYLNVTELNNELRLDARNALVNGIALVFQIEVQVKTLQAWRWDKIISSTVKTHLLKYHALSKQYVLENLETGDTDTFPDLESVLLHQGRVAAMYIVEADYLDKQENFIVQLRSRLLTSKLPLPLRMKSYFSPKWRLDSGWHEWPL